MTSDDQESAYLGQLMDEFRVENAPSVEDALYAVQERYRMIWSRLLIHTPHQFDSLQASPRPAEVPEHFVSTAERFIREIHRFLFVRVLSNAGEYRSAHDANGGVVWFGGHDRFYRQVGKFEGSAPDKIEAGVREALAQYCRGMSDPLRAVCTFYQQFVRIHPFYDANGRIARLVAAILLRVHGLEVRWSEMENKNNEFVRRLNYVHKHEKNQTFYLQILTQYVDKFTHRTEPVTESVEE